MGPLLSVPVTILILHSCPGRCGAKGLELSRQKVVGMCQLIFEVNAGVIYRFRGRMFDAILNSVNGGKKNRI